MTGPAEPSVTGPGAPAAPGGGPGPGRRGLSGGALRAGLGVAGLLLVVAVAAGDSGAGGLVIGALILLALGTMAAPGSVLPTLLVVLAIVVRTLGTAGIDGLLLAEVALIPLVHQLSGVCAAIPVAAEISARVLVPTAVRYCAAVVPVEIVVLLLRT